jgi:hypothetical protein
MGADLWGLSEKWRRAVHYDKADMTRREALAAPPQRDKRWTLAIVTASASHQ